MSDSQYICVKPFHWFELGQDGECWVCCEAWQEKPIGNILKQPFNEVWNGEIAQNIRQSMYDGTYSYCNDNCPFKKKLDGPIVKLDTLINDDSHDKRLRDAVNKRLTVMPFKPLQINCVYDRSCNLSCPSCRTKVIVAIGEDKNKVLQIQEKLVNEFMDDCHYMCITGSGDPFGSPYFRKFLIELDPENYPQLWHIHLHTNAVLWTPENWERMHRVHHLIQSAEISIDAMSEETYKVNRRGGDWNKLMENIEFISQIKVMRGFPERTLRPLEMRISFVVQENNWREMKDFVKFGQKYGFNVSFGKLIDWGTWPIEELKSKQVHLPDHPEHKEFAKFIRDPIFRQKGVQLGNLRYLLPRVLFL